MSQPISDEGIRVYSRLLTISSTLRQAVESDLRRHGLTFPQFEILARLSESPEGLRMAELASQLVVTRGGMTYRIDQLAKAGLVERTGAVEDERGILARITSQGSAALDAAMPAHIDFVAGLLSGGLAEALGRSLADLSELESRAQRSLRGAAKGGQEAGGLAPTS